jgi:hypothetical protein
MVFTIIAAMTSLHVGMCLLSYFKAIHDRWWYFPAGLGLAVLNNLLWFIAAKMVQEPKDFYFFSSCVFVGTAAVYFGLPLAFEQTKTHPFHLIAIGLIVVGLILLKL